MRKIDQDDERENRIESEAIVDTYGPEEQALGWYCYLEDRIAFPFTAHCTEERRISPLKKGEQVVVTGMAPEDDCMHEMFVEVKWQDRTLGVPLAQLEPLSVNDSTLESIGDWHYWVKHGYQLG